MNAYELLGVEPGADIDDIKRAYRRLAKALHPDLNSGDTAAAERFKEITATYNLLANARKRAEYDLNRGRSTTGGAPRPWDKGGAWFDFETDETTGERIADLFGDVAGTRMGRVKGAAATSMWMKGPDVAEDLNVTETEARDGVCRLVTTMTGLTVAVDVTAGTRNGAIIVLPGFGIEGFGGGPPGDLNVQVHVVPDPSLAGKR
jgi:DnaJ-class molecular chaperone